MLFYEKYLADIEIMKQLGVKVNPNLQPLCAASVHHFGSTMNLVCGRLHRAFEWQPYAYC